MAIKKKTTSASRRPKATPADDIKTELQALRAERKQLLEEYGNRGQLHHMNSMIGGLNPAAQRLYVVRNKIARLEAQIAKPKATLSPKGSGRGWDKRPGLLYDVSFNGRSGMIGRTQGGGNLFYIVENGKFVSGDHRTLGAAVKAFEKGR